MSPQVAASGEPLERSIGNLERAQQVLYREARLLDRHAYNDWYALWEDGPITYWIPGAGDVHDDLALSIIRDDREELAARVERLTNGWAMAHDDEVHLCRTISNVELISVETEPRVLSVESVLRLTEVRRGIQHDWVGRVFHELVQADQLRIRSKRVELVNRQFPSTILAFLL